MYELLILSLLTRKPMHGYLFIRVINDMIGPFAKVSNGRLYPLLTKLEADSLIVTVQTAQRSRTFAITDRGRTRFHRLMMDTTSNPGDYARLFWLKVPFFESLTPSEHLYLIDHYLNYCQAHIVHLTGEVTEMETDALREHYMSLSQVRATLQALQHLRNQWQLDYNDVLALRGWEMTRREMTEAAETADSALASAPGAEQDVGGQV